jgi:hypothetical protein
MRPVLAYIIALLLIVPFHTLSYVTTMLHISQHSVKSEYDEHHEGTGHSHDENGEHHEHDVDDSAPDSAPGKDLDHRHGPNQAAHSHDRDIWGLFANPGICSQISLASFPDSIPLNMPMFEVHPTISSLFSGSLLRPPIA